MRLVCPNCGAQYEVDDRVIPDSGRDVQCSSCGHGWYQMPAHAEATPEDGADDTVTAESEALAETDDEAETGPEPETQVPDVAAEAPAPPARDVAAEPDEDEDGTLGIAAAPTPGARPRRELDDNLRAILQEEVEREMQARAAERAPDPIETQPDLGLTEPERPNSAAPDDSSGSDFDDDLPDISPISDTGAETAALAAGGATAARRDLFPDIDEINSTLDRRGLPDEDEAEETTGERRGGFARGFFTVIFIAALALALYLAAPQLARSVPALEPTLAAYVDAVNGARAWIEALVQSATARIGSAG